MNTLSFAGAIPLRKFGATAPLALALMLAACGDQGAGSIVVVPAPAPSSPAPTPTPTATGTATKYDVQPCFDQIIPGTGGLTLATIVIPDTLKLDLTRPDGFPNGRTLSDQVIDIELAVLFLDVNAGGQSPATLAKLPLDPPGNDRPFSLTFPFLAPPQGVPAVASGTGSGFDFRTDADSAYVNVDRMGNPAVATALISSSMKAAYNDANPTVDATGKFVPEETSELEKLTEEIGDDLTGLGLKLCAKPL